MTSRHTKGSLAAYVRAMPDLWFAVGLAMGIVVTGFAAVGSFDRGVASVRRGANQRRALGTPPRDRRAPERAASRRSGRWTGTVAGMTELLRSDVTLLAAALFGLVLTSLAIFRDIGATIRA